MAYQGVQLNQDKFSCSICLELLKNPVSINCGHSYCSGCIESCWDQDAKTGVYSCPQCRQTFTPRPELKKNTLLAEVIEELKKNGPLSPSTEESYAGPEDVACDFCTGRKQRAIKSCLVCLASYCEMHLQPHHSVAPLRKHTLVEATKSLQEKICPRHDEMMKMFCRTDQQCICYLCSVDEHRGHDTISASAERAEKQNKLSINQEKIQQRLCDCEKVVKQLQDAVDSMNCSAELAVENNDRIQAQLIRSIEERFSELKEQIRGQQGMEVRKAEGFLQQVTREMAELQRRAEELARLSSTEDHVYFLKVYTSLLRSSDLPVSVNVDIPPLSYFKDVTDAVSKLSEELQGALEGGWTEISDTVKEVDFTQTPEPKTKADFCRYSRHLTLDPNTARSYLSLLQGNRGVKLIQKEQPYSGHPERFTYRCQVLGKEGLSGRCYWEAEWSGNVAHVAVSYKSVTRSRENSIFGENDVSWNLKCTQGCCTFTHNKIQQTIVPRLASNKIGVYLNHRKGILSFYSVSDTMTLLHTVQTTFVQPLYVGFGLGYGSGWAWGDTITLCEEGDFSFG